MKENILHYTYQTTVHEMYDLTRSEALSIVMSATNKAKEKNHALIMTGKDEEKKSFFDAFTQEKLSHNFTWIHFCPQEVLEFDEENQKEKYYVLIMTACE